MDALRLEKRLMLADRITVPRGGQYVALMPMIIVAAVR
jgi:hypothetical protein